MRIIIKFYNDKNDISKLSDEEIIEEYKRRVGEKHPSYNNTEDKQSSSKGLSKESIQKTNNNPVKKNQFTIVKDKDANKIKKLDFSNVEVKSEIIFTPIEENSENETVGEKQPKPATDNEKVKIDYSKLASLLAPDDEA